MPNNLKRLRSKLLHQVSDAGFRYETSTDPALLVRNVRVYPLHVYAYMHEMYIFFVIITITISATIITITAG